MNILSTGDLARSFFLRQSHERVRGDLSTLTQELASGTHADMGHALKGDFTALAGVERGLRLFGSYKSAAADAALTTAAAQAALQTVQDNLADMAPGLLSATGAGTLQQMELVAASAPDRLGAMVSALNQSAAGRSLFAGAATDADALAPVADIMAALDPLATGAADAANLITTLEGWFMDAGGGFETLAYQGSTDATPGFLVAEGETVENPATALDPGLRRGLMGMALAALVASDTGNFSADGKRALLEHAGLSMASGNEAVIGLRARIGHAEGRIEAAQVRTDTARAQLELERGRLTGADPYRTATELQQTETRLESLYLLTSRLSRLSLTEYLR